MASNEQVAREYLNQRAARVHTVPKKNAAIIP